MRSLPPPPASSLRVLLALGAAALLIASCGGPRDGAVADPGPPRPLIEALPPDPDAPTTLPPMVMVCGFSLVVDEAPFEIVTYSDFDDPRALSLYELNRPGYIETWVRQHPTGRGVTFRRPPAGEGGEIGRQISDVCFGDGQRAAPLIRQIVLTRAPGRDAPDALHNLLRAGRTVHFLIDADGLVHQLLDTVHAAYTPPGQEKQADVALYVALIAPRRLAEWLPDLLRPAAVHGLAAGAQPAPAPVAAADAGRGLRVAPPADAFAERRRCLVAGVPVEGEVYTDAQYLALGVLTRALAGEFPALTTDVPRDEAGAPLRRPINLSAFHQGVLADFHTAPDLVEPACIDLDRAVQPAPEPAP